MGKIVWKKLRSRKGASITFALLAFLVCAVISAVLLASASAAAGRVSGLAESDQRYYAVTSAAQLFCDGLQNQEITIERLHETKETKARVFTAVEGGSFMPGGSYTYEPDSETYNYDKYSLWVNSVKQGYPKGEKNLAKDLALYFVFGNNLKNNVEEGKLDKELNDLLENTFNFHLSTEAEFDLIMRVPTEEGKVSELDFLTVDVKLTMRKDGQVLAKFTNRSKDNKFFTVEVVMMPKIQDDSDHPVIKDTTTVRNMPESDHSYLELTTTTTETTKTTTISWTVSEIRKGTAS